MSFWKRNLGFAKLAALTQLEYRMNFLSDVMIQPLMTAAIELALWSSVFMGTDLIAGFTRAEYFSYVVWSAVVARVTSNWLFEYKMIYEIDRGTINSLLVRPFTFFEYYLSQFLTYKLMSSLMTFPMVVVFVFYKDWPFHANRLLPAIFMILLFLVFSHLLSMFIASLAFQFHKTYSLTTAKNLLLWSLTGELFPLDLMPAPWKDWVLALPFSNAVYRPVAFLVGRIGWQEFNQGFMSLAAGFAVVGIITWYSWQSGTKTYAGTGA